MVKSLGIAVSSPSSFSEPGESVPTNGEWVTEGNAQSDSVVMDTTSRAGIQECSAVHYIRTVEFSARQFFCYIKSS